MEKPNEDWSETKLVTICSLTDSVQAELVRNTLLDHGVECELDGETQAGFSGTFEIGVIVRESDAAKAKEFLEIHHPQLFGDG